MPVSSSDYPIEQVNPKGFDRKFAMVKYDTSGNFKEAVIGISKGLDLDKDVIIPPFKTKNGIYGDEPWHKQK